MRKKVALLLLTMMAAALVALSGGVALALDVTCEPGNNTSAPCLGTKAEDLMTGTPADDYIKALGGADTVNALEGADEVFGGQAGDTLEGGEGADHLYGKGGHDTLNEGSTPADGPVGFLCGGDGGDKLNGGSGTDWYFFAPGWGKDKIRGEETDPPPASPADPAETLWFFPGFEGCGDVVPVALTIDLAKGVAFETDAGPTGANTVSFKAPEIENAVGGSGDDIIKGNKSRNNIRGDDGNDTIDVGGGGRDIVFCGAGNDTVWAGGNDGISGCETVHLYDYSAVDDFSATQNPRGVWSYGSLGSTGSSPTLYTNQSTPYPGLERWSLEGSDEPMVAYNSTDQPLSYSSVVHPPDMLNLHPGPSGQKSVVRWTAPARGSATIEGKFEGIDTAGTTTDVAVVVNREYSSETLLTSNVNGYGDTVSVPYVRPVVAGDTIDFLVGYGSNATNSDDSTGLSATIYLKKY